MSPLVTQARRFRDEDDGFTLVELLTAITIGVVIVAAAFGAATAANRLQNKTTMRIDAINRGRNAMEAVTSAVRSQQCAYGVRPMLWASGQGMEFYGSGSAFKTTPTALQPIQRFRIEWIQNTAKQAADAQIGNNAHPTGNIVETIETQTNVGSTPITFGPEVKRVIAQDVEQAPDRNFNITPTTPPASIPYVPFFQYYQYIDAVGDGRIDYNNPLPMVASAADANLNPLGLASVATAELSGIVLVQVNFRSTPRQSNSDGNSGVTSSTAGVNFYNTISVRIADPSNPGGSPQCL